MLDGVDHLEIEPELPRIIELLNAGMEDAEFRHVALSEYEDALRRSDPVLETIPGELYTVGKRGINNQVLKNVLSSMVHIKQLNDARCTKMSLDESPVSELPVDRNEVTLFAKPGETITLELMFGSS